MIHNSLKGKDRAKKIIEVTAGLTQRERAEVSKRYGNDCGYPISRDLKKALSGLCEELVVDLYAQRFEFWALQIKDALSKKKLTQSFLYQLVLPMTVHEFACVSQQYQYQNGQRLNEAIR